MIIVEFNVSFKENIEISDEKSQKFDLDIKEIWVNALLLFSIQEVIIP